MNGIDSNGPSHENAGIKNELALPDALKKENFVIGAKKYVHFKAENGLFLDIDSSGWAFWSNNSRAAFSIYDYDGDTYLVYEYGNSHTGKYLSYSNTGYIGVYGWGDSVAWSLDPLRVKNKPWETYEYTNGPTYVVIGKYQYPARDLNVQDGF